MSRRSNDMSRLRLLWFQSETTPKHLVRVVLTRVFYIVFTRLGLRLLRRIFVIALRVSACHQKNTDSYQQEILSVPCIQAARPRSFGLWANHIFACTGVAVLKSKKYLQTATQIYSKTISIGFLSIQCFICSNMNP